MVTVHTDGPVTVLSVRGDLAILTAPSLRTAARDVPSGAPDAVVVEVTAVTFLGAAGITAASDPCRRLALAPSVRRSRERSRHRPSPGRCEALSEILSVTPDLRSAVAHIRTMLGPAYHPAHRLTPAPSGSNRSTRRADTPLYPALHPRCDPPRCLSVASPHRPTNGDPAAGTAAIRGPSP